MAAAREKMERASPRPGADASKLFRPLEWSEDLKVRCLGCRPLFALRGVRCVYARVPAVGQCRGVQPDLLHASRGKCVHAGSRMSAIECVVSCAFVAGLCALDPALVTMPGVNARL